MTQLLRSMPPRFSNVPIVFSEHLFERYIAGTAGYTVVVYDLFLTLDKEIEYIWKAEWSLVKTLYLVNKYGNIGLQTYFCIERTGVLYQSEDTKFCWRYNILVLVSIWLSTESLHILVLLRAWVIWGCRRKISIALIGLYSAYMGLALTVCLMSAQNPVWNTSMYLGTIGTCVGFLSEESYAFWIGSLLLDTGVFLCTMCSLHRYEQDCPYRTRLRRHLEVSALLLYAACVLDNVFAIMIWKSWGNSDRLDPRWFLNITLSGPVLSISGQRFVRDLRSLKGQNLGLASANFSAEIRRQLHEVVGDTEDDMTDGAAWGSWARQLAAWSLAPIMKELNELAFVLTQGNGFETRFGVTLRQRACVDFYT
ncbi:hypothetical protein CONPUDRAFT_147308 [Coniophora puteana RWD-64-598 SS2]|uniref:DUF6533 domain-containing protein n=1 Tax=Coniophora puteana (strain RWD-64-598) TaxID=741705 RepID=A0A5M3M8P0_CONPW|nr:uncharacterized protein CONPUDRAFT_147308 [Coniophora puteana RWD-64-598 SS2]EIW75145.1 hypothetical protein CONPUDRAFT_147308 [Coniophora puteana RWD-64-598 SS2]